MNKNRGEISGRSDSNGRPFIDFYGLLSMILGAWKVRGSASISSQCKSQGGLMSKLMAILLCSILLSGCASTFAEKWSTGDTIREVTYGTLHVVDWGQTRYIAKHPDKYEERNPLIGRHPSTGRVDIYMGSTLLLHPVISGYLKPEYRRWWQYITIGIEGGAVVNNASIGVKIGF